jgi:hypothetical protein
MFCVSPVNKDSESVAAQILLVTPQRHERKMATTATSFLEIEAQRVGPESARVQDDCYGFV